MDDKGYDLLDISRRLGNSLKVAAGYIVKNHEEKSNSFKGV
jgi:hypothetical protein